MYYDLSEKRELDFVEGINPDFVGLFFRGGHCYVAFPYGYQLAGTTDRKMKLDVRALLSTVVLTKRNYPGFVDSPNLENNLRSYEPYIEVIEDYLLHGAYHEIYSEIGERRIGRCDWEKTFQGKKLIGEDSVYFQNPKYKIPNSRRSPITDIQFYCLHIAKERIGILFDDFSVPRPSITQDDIPHYLFFIKEKLSHSYLDREKKLLMCLVAILEGTSGNPTSRSRDIGTTNYHVVWENTLRSLYGNRTEKDFCPEARYRLVEMPGEAKSSSLRPDIIRLEGSNLYILDAKYYRYGCVMPRDPHLLPNTESVTKQFAYARYGLKRQCGSSAFDSSHIFNAFILPSNEPGVPYYGYGSMEEVEAVPPEQRNSFSRVYLFGLNTNQVIADYLKSKHGLEDLITEIDRIHSISK